jgi:hypothetical protein
MEQVAASEEFREAPKLSALLRFVVERQVEGRGAEVKESTIAVEVFGRSPDFDGRLDNSVRMSASRLRTRLAAYYAGTGRDDEILIEIPRGSYLPLVSVRSAPAPPALPAQPTPMPTPPALPAQPTPPSAPRRREWLTAGLAAAAALGGMFWWLGYRQGLGKSPASDVPEIVRSFYGRLASRPLLLVYRVPVFLRLDTPYPLMLLYDGHTTGQTYEQIPLPADVDPDLRERMKEKAARYENTWTDVGSTLGVFEVGNLLGKTGAHVTIQDSLSLNVDQSRDQNLIVISPPYFSALMPQLPPLRHFTISTKDALITDPSPPPDKPKHFSPAFDPAGHWLRTTWGVVSLGPGIWPGTRLLRISGLNPLGVAGAATYMTSAAGLEELSRGLGSPGKLPDDFEAVLQVNCLKGQVSTVAFTRGVSRFKEN